MIRALLAAALAAIAPLPLAQDAELAKLRAEWNAPAEPFRVVGPIHYVGTAGLSSFLITTRAGHVLVDGGMDESAPRIAANVARLGYRMRDVRYILINHAHWDHAGGLAGLKRLAPRAVLIASAPERPTLELGRSPDRDDLSPFERVRVDRVVADKQSISIGGFRLTAHLTPGHTQGCTSWSIPFRDPRIGGRGLTALFACSLTVAGQQLIVNPRYPEVVDDFRHSFALLDRMRADVFLTFHPEFFGMKEKRQAQLGGDVSAFVDPGELKRRLVTARTAFETELKRQRRNPRVTVEPSPANQ
jgi:metallo-beta-lactamase class B